MTTSTFPDVSKIPFEGSRSKNPLAFQHYDADELVEGKSMREDGRLAGLVKERYASWDGGVGAEIEAGKHTFDSLGKLALANPDPVQRHSEQQEFIENLLNNFV